MSDSNLTLAADVNTICQRQQQVSPITVRLNMWNKTNLKLLGETRLILQILALVLNQK